MRAFLQDLAVFGLGIIILVAVLFAASLYVPA